MPVWFDGENERVPYEVWLMTPCGACGTAPDETGVR
jgi:hypothetical protein